MINWVLTHWPSIALAILPLLAVNYCWQFREKMNLWAWLFYGVFVALFFASNSWRFVPFPENPTLEQGRLWLNDARLVHTVSLKWCAVAAVAVAFLAGRNKPIRGAVALMMATVVAAMLGEAMEFSYCRLRDPVKGFAHIYYYEGGTQSVCGRVAEAWAGFGWIGVWLTPILTVVPSVIAMGWTSMRKT
jgi:hypothetical protein